MPKDQTTKWREAKQRYRAKQKTQDQNSDQAQDPGPSLDINDW